jgi:hypothetical protein
LASSALGVYGDMFERVELKNKLLGGYGLSQNETKKFNLVEFQSMESSGIWSYNNVCFNKVEGKTNLFM